MRIGRVKDVFGHCATTRRHMRKLMTELNTAYGEGLITWARIVVGGWEKGVKNGDHRSTQETLFVVCPTTRNGTTEWRRAWNLEDTRCIRTLIEWSNRS